VLAAVALLALAVYPAQRTVRGATAKNGSDYRSAARIIERDEQPGDSIVYTAHSRTLRAGLDSYLRRYPRRPSNLLLARDQHLVDAAGRPPGRWGRRRHSG
jgi:mannosyltransferase